MSNSIHFSSLRRVVVSILLTVSITNAFQLNQHTFLVSPAKSVFRTQKVTSALYMAKKSRGFDKSIPKSTPPKKQDKDSPLESQISTPTFSNDNSEGLNAGQKALEKLREQQQSTKDEELRKIQEIRKVDESIRDDPTAAVIPEKVAMRMGSRMLPFVGIPLFGTMGAFIAFWYLRTYKNVEFETNVVAFTTIGFLVVGLLGITYSVMSASWDPDREGSTFGADEFAENFGSIQDGLKRSKENLILREKMAGLPEEEIEAAVQALDKRDERARMKSMSLKDKMKNELQ